MRHVRPQAKRSLYSLLDEQRSEFDDLLADVGGGVRGAVHFDGLEERGRKIAGQIIDAFRRASR